MLKTSATILIVENSASTSQKIAEILVGFGENLLFADKDEYVFEQIDQHQVDLFVIDSTMPDIDGITLIKEIRKRSKCANTPILMMTELAENSLYEETFQAGATDVIHKPLNQHELNARVVSLIEKYHAERTVKELLSEMRKRNQDLFRTQQELETFIDSIQYELSKTQDKLNQQLLTLSESVTNNADLGAINYYLNQQLTNLQQKNTELQSILESHMKNFG